LSHDALEDRHGVVGGDGAADIDGEGLLGELVGDVKSLSVLKLVVWSNW
jgi:hypothetical protein